MFARDCPRQTESTTGIPTTEENLHNTRHAAFAKRALHTHHTHRQHNTQFTRKPPTTKENPHNTHCYNPTATNTFIDI